HVTTSEAILGYADKAAVAGDFGTITPRQNLLKGRKGKTINVTDKQADEKLLVSTIDEAEALAKKLVSKTDADIIDYLARQLFDKNPNHPAVAAYNDWRRLKKAGELRGGLARMFHAGVERNFEPDTEARRVPIMPKKAHTVSIDPAKTGKPTRQTAVLPEERRVVIDPATVGNAKKETAASKGYRNIDPSQLTEPARTDGLTRITTNGYNQFMTHQGVSGYSGPISDFKGAGFKQMTGYDTLEQFVMAPKTKAWEYEYALYCLLDRKDTLTYEDLLQSATPGHAPASRAKTFLERVPEEAPRKLVFQRKYGKGASKEVHTIEYGRTPIRSRVRKLGALAAAVALAFPAGQNLSTAAYEYGEYYAGTYECPPQDVSDTPEERDKYEACLDEREAYADDNLFIATTDGIQEKHSTLEESLLFDAYSRGLLTESSLSMISEHTADDWLAEKKQEMGEYANLLHDNNGSSIANEQDPSAPDAPNPVIWEVVANDSGVGTGGFWAQGVASRMSIQDFGGVPGSVMPFRNAIVEVGGGDVYIYDPQTKRLGAETTGTAATESDEVAHYDGFRKLSLRPMSAITAADKLMVIEGSQATINSWEIAFSPDHSDNRTQLYSLPVLTGADVKAVQVEIRDYRHDTVLRTLQPDVFQLPDGSFKFVMPSEKGVIKDDDEGYMRIRYAIDPAAITDKLVRTPEPFHIQKRGEYSKPLNKVLTAADEAAIRKAINAGPQDSATEVAEAWQDGHGYKYSPYTGLHGKESVEGMSTREIMMDITDYAINMDEVNCTVSAMSALMATRGKDGSRDLGYAIGMNDDGDGKLTKVESHAKIIRDDGLQIELTPSANDASDKPPVITEGSKVESSPIDIAIGIGSAAVAFSAGVLVGTKGLTAASGVVTRRRRRKAEDYIVLAKATPTQLATDLTLLNALRYAPEGTVVSEAMP
ncbi:MAG TPA: hypothetical protein VD735_07250, partial [Candidatus Saccharimonadales bacterium]|nr:hypothetical protein [Candidatus Saccharimonadales bacterium]